ncbi:hypothetical protein [Vibrio crassostreae]|uniref:hypothetical protein n=1 Tax=Vibrio crassostreae TaxID=246167 RepID=UPI00111321B5|nr:hypothetical protein [Vibrio crassostreae]
MMELDQRRLIVVKNLLNKLEFYTDEVVEEGNRKGLCIDINGWHLYPVFQFDESMEIHCQLKRRLDDLRTGRDDIDVLHWLFAEKTVLMCKAVAPYQLVDSALSSGDLKAHDALVSAEASQSEHLAARPVDLLGRDEFDVFVDDWKLGDYRMIPRKEVRGILGW